MNPHFKRKLRKIISPVKKIGLKNKKFTIISNNCWGGYVYDTFGLKYLSPTIGLYFFSQDYVKFVSNLTYYLNLEAYPISVYKSKHKDKILKNGNNMVGRIGDIEVVFVHYKSAIEACDKWNKRRKRVDFNNLLVKYNDQNFFKKEDLIEMLSLNIKNFIFFTSKKSNVLNNNCYLIEKYKDDDFVKEDIKSSHKIISIKKILNNML